MSLGCLVNVRNILRKKNDKKIREWCQEDAPLHHLYQSLQHLRYVLKSETKKRTDIRLKQWFDHYLFNDCAAVKSIAKTLVTRREALLLRTLFSYSNSIMEGTNNKLKLIKQRALDIETSNDLHCAFG
ncbi:transposase [Anoxybacillus flavithermus]